MVAAVSLAAPELSALPLGAQKSPLRARNAEDSTLANVTFTGFRRLSDGRALLYVELTARVNVTVVQKPGGVTYRLEGARVALKNNRNPLLTSAFETSLLSARLVVPKASSKKGHGKSTSTEAPHVDLVLSLRPGASPTHTMSERAGGAVLEITIPVATGSK
jgi:hypothetical protein